jgi:hypothetical protein
LSNLVAHARRELELCGQIAEDPAYAASLIAAVAAFASYERTRIALRTYRGKLRSVAKGGHWGGRPPFGTTYVDGQLAVHPEELEVILTIRKMTVVGASQEALSAACAAPRGGQVQVKTVSKIQRGVFPPVLAAAIKARYNDEGAKRNEVGVEAADIPTDKAGLLEWLNKEAAKA